MLSIELIRRDPEQVRRALEARGEAASLVELLTLDAERRQALTKGRQPAGGA